MNRKNYPLYALAVAVVAIGAIWAGVPASTLLLIGLVLTCPLMMLFMHGGHGGHGVGGHAGHGTEAGNQGGNATHHHAPATDQDRPSPTDPAGRR